MTRRRSESERPPHLDSRLSTAPAQSASKPEDPRPVMLARIDARIRARSRSVSATKSATLALGAWTERAVTHCGLTVSEIASHLGMARTTLTEFRRQANAADYTITDEQDGGSCSCRRMTSSTAFSPRVRWRRSSRAQTPATSSTCQVSRSTDSTSRPAARCRTSWSDAGTTQTTGSC